MAAQQEKIQNMGKKAVLNLADKKVRAQRRSEIGSLRDNRIQKQTHNRYNLALVQYFNRLERNNAEYQDIFEILDESLIQYAESLWEDGVSRNYLADVLSALGFYYPILK